MGYCRFQNTVGDFRDCAEALEEGLELSVDETNAALRLLELCRTIADGFTADDIKAMKEVR
jgi:hypothetical protein